MKFSGARITLIYTIAGVLWILLSDYLLFFWYDDAGYSWDISTVKGITYVILSAAGLYYLLTLRENQLKKATSDYQRLFSNNPNPMFIYNPEDYKILDVNHAALLQYGYSRAEFLKISILDIRPAEEQEQVKEVIDRARHFQDSGVWRHIDKAGTERYYHIYGNATHYKGKDARLVVAINVDEQVKNRYMILEQNEKLRQIAHMQAHDLRGPVSTILGLVSIFDKENHDQKLNCEVMEKLGQTAERLDHTIKKIVEKTDDVDHVH